MDVFATECKVTSMIANCDSCFLRVEHIKKKNAFVSRFGCMLDNQKLHLLKMEPQFSEHVSPSLSSAGCQIERLSDTL